jgi:biotin carboxyl carrier protein
MKYEVRLKGAHEEKNYVVELEATPSGLRISLGGQAVDADAALIASGTVSVLMEGKTFEVHVTPSRGDEITVQAGPHEFTAEVRDPRAWQGRRHGALEAKGRQQIIAPMPGKIVRLLVAAGDAVEAGQGLVVVEAMKMQNEIRSPKKGKVERLQAKEGQAVNAGDVLAWVD